MCTLEHRRSALSINGDSRVPGLLSILPSGEPYKLIPLRCFMYTTWSQIREQKFFSILLTVHDWQMLLSKVVINCGEKVCRTLYCLLQTLLTHFSQEIPYNSYSIDVSYVVKNFVYYNWPHHPLYVSDLPLLGMESL